MLSDASGRPSAPLVTVCVLNYNGREYAKRCLSSVALSRYPNFEIVVVDNASTDGSPEEIERALALVPASIPVRFQRLSENRGYAVGQNTAAGFARGEYLAFLNVSCEVEPEWLDLVAWFEGQPDVGFAQPMITFYDDRDRIQSLGSQMSKMGELNVVGRGRRLRPNGLEHPVVHDVFSVHGAAFVTRRSIFDALGGFDESFFLYFEESDLCWRGWLRGVRSVCFYDPRSVGRVFHRVHACAPARADVQRFFDRNRTVSMIRNLETRDLRYVLFNALVVTTELVRYPGTLARYYWEVFQRLPAAFHDRRRVQATRIVSDDRIMGLPEPPHVAALGDRPP